MEFNATLKSKRGGILTFDAESDIKNYHPIAKTP